MLSTNKVNEWQEWDSQATSLGLNSLLNTGGDTLRGASGDLEILGSGEGSNSEKDEGLGELHGERCREEIRRTVK
jgi:hypothetical protein